MTRRDGTPVQGGTYVRRNGGNPVRVNEKDKARASETKPGKAATVPSAPATPPKSTGGEA